MIRASIPAEGIKTADLIIVFTSGLILQHDGYTSETVPQRAPIGLVLYCDPL